MAKIAAQSSSQILPMEISEPVLKWSRTWQCVADLESWVESGILTEWVAVRVSPLDAWTVGPVVVFWLSVHTDWWEYWM